MDQLSIFESVRQKSDLHHRRGEKQCVIHGAVLFPSGSEQHQDSRLGLQHETDHVYEYW